MEGLRDKNGTWLCLGGLHTTDLLAQLFLLSVFAWARLLLETHPILSGTTASGTKNLGAADGWMAYRWLVGRIGGIGCCRPVRSDGRIAHA